MTVNPRTGSFLCLLHGNSFGDNKQALRDFKPQINPERGYPALFLMRASSSASHLQRGFLVFKQKQTKHRDR